MYVIIVICQVIALETVINVNVISHVLCLVLKATLKVVICCVIM